MNRLVIERLAPHTIESGATDGIVGVSCAGTVEIVRKALIYVGATALVASLTACGGPAPVTSQSPSGAASPSASQPDPSVAPSSAAPEEVTPDPSQAPEVVPTPEAPKTTLPPVAQPSAQGGPWTTVNAKLTSGAEAMAASSLPESFRAFLASRIGVQDDADCTTKEVDVVAIHPDGFAYGTEESDCSSSQVVWGITEQQWHYINTFEDAIPCTEFVTNGVPPGVPGLRCLENNQAKDY